MLLAQEQIGTLSPRFWPADFLPDGRFAPLKLQKRIVFLPNHDDESRKPKDGRSQMCSLLVHLFLGRF